MITIKGQRVYENVIDVPEGTSGPVKVQHIIKPAGSKIPLSNARTAFFGQRTFAPLVFDRDTRWHQLVERHVGVWMTDLPIEQRQHDEAFIGYKGRILVGGLGLGYAVTVLGQKRHVERIVAVERSQHVANLVWDHTKHEGKGELVVSDLMLYLRNATEKFDRAFFDIWQGDGESTFHNVVVPLRRLAVDKVKHVDCWNEDVMRGQLAMGLTSRLSIFEHQRQSKQEVPGLVSLDQLCERASGSGAIYVNWALPFWRWYRRERPAFNSAQEMASLYASVYGMPRADAMIAMRFGEEAA